MGNDLFEIMLIEALFGPVPALRTRCHPDDRAPGEHTHACSCGTAWRHSDMLPLLISSEQEFKTAHECPSCGNHVSLKQGY